MIINTRMMIINIVELWALTSESKLTSSKNKLASRKTHSFPRQRSRTHTHTHRNVGYIAAQQVAITHADKKRITDGNMHRRPRQS